jgi:hypothetical protein
VQKAVTTQRRNWRVFLVVVFGFVVLTFPFIGPEGALILGGLGIVIHAFSIPSRRPSRPSRGLRWLSSIIEVVLVGPRWGRRWGMDLASRLAERRGPVFWVFWIILGGLVGLAILDDAWDLAASVRYDGRVLTYAEHPFRSTFTLVMQALSGLVWLGLFAVFVSMPFVVSEGERRWQRRVSRPPLDTARRRPAAVERPGTSAPTRTKLAP